MLHHHAVYLTQTKKSVVIWVLLKINVLLKDAAGNNYLMDQLFLGVLNKLTIIKNLAENLTKKKRTN